MSEIIDAAEQPKMISNNRENAEDNSEEQLLSNSEKHQDAIGDDDHDEHGHPSTFRKRRLTVSSGFQIEGLDELRALAASSDESDDDDDDDDDDDGPTAPVPAPAHMNKKHSEVEDNDQTPELKRPRISHLEDRKKTVSMPAVPLEPKIKFSQQMKLLVQKYCPISHGHTDLVPLPNGDTIIMTNHDAHTDHIASDDSLPFPKKLVWTYSCHGIEPIFDDENEDEDIPSTVAKINQDRGGVAFPYGNCARTALFSVYDGKPLLTCWLLIYKPLRWNMHLYYFTNTVYRYFFHP